MFKDFRYHFFVDNFQIKPMIGSGSKILERSQIRGSNFLSRIFSLIQICNIGIDQTLPLIFKGFLRGPNK